MAEQSSAKIEILYDAEAIAARVDELAEDIAKTNPHRLLIVIVLKGGFVFGADLARALARHHVGLEVEFISLSSYGSSLKTSGEVRILRDIGCPVEDREVLLVDDVLDSGLTLQFAKDLMEHRGARKVTVAAIVDKPQNRTNGFVADYVGFTSPDYFLVGYGMDAAHAWRELPDIGILKSDDTETSH